MTDNSAIRIALMDDNAIVRKQLGDLIHNAGDLELVGAYDGAAAALCGVSLVKPDVVVMDIEMADMDGVDCVRFLKARLPDANFLILTVCEDVERLFEALRAGASGYLLKQTAPARLLEAIREVHEGGSPMSPWIARQVVRSFAENGNGSGNNHARLGHLSPGESKALDELAQGYAYKVIADHLGISVHGVRNYIRKIYEKLQVHSRTEAVIKYMRHQEAESDVATSKMAARRQPSRFIMVEQRQGPRYG